MGLAVASLGAVAGGAGLYIAPLVSRLVAQRRLARLCASQSALALTYDDGPGRDATPRLLDLLHAHGARASFFALGRKAESEPATLDRVVREGHEVGCHSYCHVHPWKSLPWAAANDVTRGFRALAPWVARDGLFRPPHGKLSPFSWAVARAGGARFAWWTHDSGDTWEDLPRSGDIVDVIRRSGGGVVLMHDCDRDESRVGYVLELTERLLGMSRAEGLRVVTQGELLAPTAGDGRSAHPEARKP
jgi:peptidoglycan/xylan/chitin deacetylase (PgdA/CDA1 family)